MRFSKDKRVLTRVLIYHCSNITTICALGGSLAFIIGLCGIKIPPSGFLSIMSVQDTTLSEWLILIGAALIIMSVLFEIRRPLRRDKKLVFYHVLLFLSALVISLVLVVQFHDSKSKFLLGHDTVRKESVHEKVDEEGINTGPYRPNITIILSKPLTRLKRFLGLLGQIERIGQYLWLPGVVFVVYASAVTILSYYVSKLTLWRVTDKFGTLRRFISRTADLLEEAIKYDLVVSMVTYSPLIGNVTNNRLYQRRIDPPLNILRNSDRLKIICLKTLEMYEFYCGFGVADIGKRFNEAENFLKEYQDKPDKINRLSYVPTPSMISNEERAIIYYFDRKSELQGFETHDAGLICQFHRMFDELLDRKEPSVRIGTPDSRDYKANMRELVKELERMLGDIEGKGFKLSIFSFCPVPGRVTLRKENVVINSISNKLGTRVSNKQETRLICLDNGALNEFYRSFLQSKSEESDTDEITEKEVEEANIASESLIGLFPDKSKRFPDESKRRVPKNMFDWWVNFWIASKEGEDIQGVFWLTLINNGEPPDFRAFSVIGHFGDILIEFFSRNWAKARNPNS